ncbi:hypothetical protein GDO81_026593 [Engystomops pustulosus]|uniref:Uncharacterized protein n=1 Tax=Engystomops pustulosus TaxID=76066 RepID=A0AAV6YI20_ENGPU|nr:hypothetical protein GDO81_026593 [Engystomops pustulosus]
MTAMTVGVAAEAPPTTGRAVTVGGPEVGGLPTAAVITVTAIAGVIVGGAKRLFCSSFFIPPFPVWHLKPRPSSTLCSVITAAV